jgi:hypothetical protein
MNCEVVAVGTELLLGQIVDTNSSWIGEQLALAGIDCFLQVKVGDNWVVPLCHKCHMELHHYGDEKTWWDLQGIEPLAWAKDNWEKFNGR